MFAEAGLTVARWRTVPFDDSALGASAAESRPGFAQAVVARPIEPSGRPATDDAFERRLVVARRRLETAVREGPRALAGLCVPSASCRTVVYKGLVTGARLPQLFPDLRAPLSLAYAVFHQRYATNTHPVWGLAQPFRLIAHNGEINTVRGNREQVRGRTRDTGAKAIAAELLAAGPLLSPDGSDSLSLDEALELLMTTGWDLTPALLAAIPEALALRRSPHPHVATLRRRTAGFLAPWDGPAAIVFADGIRVGAMVDRNGLRPASFAVTRDRLVAVASEAGAVPFAAKDTIRRGRLGPGELLLVEPGRRAILEDAEAKSRALRACRSTTHHGRSTRTAPRRPPRRSPTSPCRSTSSCDTSRASMPSAHGSTSRRWRSRATSRCGAWATTRRPPAAPASTGPSPTTCARPSRRSRTRRSTRNASGSSWTCGSSWVDARRCSVARRAVPRTLRLDRPIVADLDGLMDAVRDGGKRVRRLDLTWAAADGPSGLESALATLASTAVAASEAGIEVLLLSDDGFDLERLPVPSILAAGAVHAALTEAGLRGRTDLVVDAADVLDVHAMAMLLAVGATAVHPRLAIELAAELAGTRGAETVTPARGDRRTRQRPSRPGFARPWPGWASARSRRTSAGRSSTSSISTRRSSSAASRPPPTGRAGRPSPISPPASSDVR